MSNSPSAADYGSLQNSIDQVVGKIGLQRTIFLLNSFITNTSVSHNETEKMQMLTRYLVNEAIQAFNLDTGMFYVCGERSYRDARMCCFHLLRKYTDYTFSKIGLTMHCSERAVMYGSTVAEQRLGVTKGNHVFNSRYSLLESKLIEFISKVN